MQWSLVWWYVCRRWREFQALVAGCTRTRRGSGCGPMMKWRMMHVKLLQSRWVQSCLTDRHCCLSCQIIATMSSTALCCLLWRGQIDCQHYVNHCEVKVLYSSGPQTHLPVLGHWVYYWVWPKWRQTFPAAEHHCHFGRYKIVLVMVKRYELYTATHCLLLTVGLSLPYVHIAGNNNFCTVVKPGNSYLLQL